MKKIILSKILILFCLSTLCAQDANRRPMTVDDALNMVRLRDVQMSLDGRTFVYHAPSDKDFDLTHGFLWIMNPDTGEKRQLKEPNQGRIYTLTWMPDGKSLLFNETRRTNLNLHRINLATGKVQDITNVKGTLRALAFSKDRTKMVYSYIIFK